MLLNLEQANRLDIALYDCARDILYPRQLQRCDIDDAPAQPESTASGQRWSLHSYLNIAYRQLVNKPVV